MELNYTEEDVDALENLFDAMSICEDSGIDYGELETVEELQKLLKDRLKAAWQDERAKVWLSSSAHT